ncbi:MAG: ATP-binding protein [Acidobacteriota bacterium]
MMTFGEATSAAPAAGPQVPALPRAGIVSAMALSVWVAVAAAILLVGFALTQVDAPREALVLGIAIFSLAVGHAFLRTRAWKSATEAELDRSRAELVLQAQMGECEQRRKSLAAFAQLAAHVAHEVRNPLSAIMLNAELLEEEAARCNCDGAEEAKALVASIRTEAERLQHLTDEYLAFARPPRRSATLHPLNAVVEDLIHLVREEAAQSGVAIDTRLSREDPSAVLDPQQMKQAALNLVRNALQAMPDGGRLLVETHALGDGRVALAVQDTGPGIPEELRCRVFEPFFTSKQTGTGLGLPLALHIVRDHDGEIEFENAPDGGARFTVLLPSAPAADGASASPAGRRGEGPSP